MEKIYKSIWSSDIMSPFGLVIRGYQVSRVYDEKFHGENISVHTRKRHIARSGIQVREERANNYYHSLNAYQGQISDDI